MIKVKSHRYNLKVKSSVITALRKFEQIEDRNEAGGILLGKVAIKNEQINIIVTDITTPTKVDYRSRCKFIRRKEPAQNVINDKWKESNGKVNYLGEWHTHPECNPTPSFYDEKMIKKTNSIVKSDLDFTILFIIGLNNTFWIGIRNGNELVVLN